MGASPLLSWAEEIGDVTRGLECEHPSLAVGAAGMAVLHAALGNDEEAERQLEEARRMLATVHVGSSLYGGLAGVAWAAALLPDHAGPRLVGLVEREIDPRLLALCERTPWKRPYDLIDGVVGLGVYAMRRLDAPIGRPLLAAVVRRLAELADEEPTGLTWRTPARHLPEFQREMAPNGYRNLGLAHGVPGVVGLLGLVCAAGGDEKPAAERLLRPAVAWLLAQERSDGDAAAFPSWLGDDDNDPPTRTAWCYGEPGVAAALMAAGRGAGEPDWERRALAIAHRAARRDPDATGVGDAGLCHGAAGLALVFQRLHEASGDEELGAAAACWADRTLAFRLPKAPFTVQASIPGSGGDDRVWEDAPGLLEGAAGVALALLTVEGRAPTGWDGFLLLP